MKFSMLSFSNRGIQKAIQGITIAHKIRDKLVQDLGRLQRRKAFLTPGRREDAEG
jgi:hypothetical protein